MNVYNAMNTAKWALLTNQSAIEVTGQNIANVSNPDYNKQDVMLSTSTPINYGNVTIGTGVRLESVVRRFDDLVFQQTLEANFTLENWKSRVAIMDRLDIVLNEADTGLGGMMSDVFQGFYNLAINPEGAVERRDVIEKASTLSQNVSRVGTELKRLRMDIDRKLKTSMPEVNRITSEIARLNSLVHETEMGSNKANDYRDTRDALLKDLSTFMDVNYFEQNNHEIAVMLNDGRPLVVGQNSYVLSVKASQNDATVSDILWEDASGNQVNISSEFSAGQFGGWLGLRDGDIPNFLEKLDTLAATVVKEVNRLHEGGFGLDGSTGNTFFNNLRPGGRADVANLGGAILGAGSVTNPETVNLDHFVLTFDGAGNYSVYNSDKGSASGTYSFTSGANLSFFQQRGIAIGIFGGPAAGDKFYISGADNAAFNMSLNQQIVDNPGKIAAGSSTNVGDGIQARNIADLQYKKTIGGAWSSVGAASGTYSASGLFTFDDYLGAVVGEVGALTKNAHSNRQVSESISNQVMNFREQISGVSIDEEMVNLVKYQHAYGAAAKMITTVDELLQTLLNIV